ncbi:MAG: ROK family protein [bacterium]
MSFSVGVDIGGTSVKIGCWEGGRPLIWRNGLPVPQDRDGLAVASAIAALIRECLPASDSRPACIGVGTCGMVQRGRILMSPNTEWDEVPLTDFLSTEFACPVQVLNDADAYLLGVLQDEAETGSIACGFTLGTGLGTAVWLGDRLLGTACGTSPEGGHITLDMHGEAANTGIPGSFESLCCITAIQRYYQERGGLTLSPELIASAAGNGEQAARDAWFHYGECLGAGLGSFTNIFYPERIYIGGGLAGAREHFLPAALQRLAMHSLRTTPRPEIIFPADNASAIAWGSVRYLAAAAGSSA